MLHNISIHTSAREVTLHLSQFHSCYLFQSTLLQGKWRIKALKSFSDVISIHTSAREVTGDARWRMQRHGYFNPHFRKGSDRTHGTAGHGLYHFNPHFRKGSDYTGQRRRSGHRISIHTSAREVTPCSSSICVRYWDFNPHFRKGSDEMSVLITYLSYISIHTSAREVTDTAFIPINLLPNFNPHFRKGSDVSGVESRQQAVVFQSTLPQGKWPCHGNVESQ